MAFYTGFSVLSLKLHDFNSFSNNFSSKGYNLPYLWLWWSVAPPDDTSWILSWCQRMKRSSLQVQHLSWEIVDAHIAGRGAGHLCRDRMWLHHWCLALFWGIGRTVEDKIQMGYIVNYVIFHYVNDWKLLINII